MWHSTQSTRACAPCAWARVSSGCTEWHIVAQKALLLLYSQATMPPAPSTASASPPITNKVARRSRRAVSG
jgi:hypothetical protein